MADNIEAVAKIVEEAVNDAAIEEGNGAEYYARQIDALYQKPETTARQDMAHFQATQYQPDDRIIPVPPYGDKIDITANLKAQLAHCTPLIEARERERIYKVLTGKCKLHYPTDRNRSDYMKPQIVIDEKDYLEALKPEFKKGEPNVIE